MLNRRDVLELAAAAVAISGGQLAAGTDSATDRPADFEIVDTNVSLFRWPFRRLPLDETDKLVGKLRSLGVTQAWASSFEAVLHRDLASVNQRLAETCREFPELIPMGAVNPALPGWESDLRRCVEDFNMPGIRLLPGYHGYPLDDSRIPELLKRAATAGVVVQIAMSLEDPRTQSELVRIADVDLSRLLPLLPKVPHARVQILNQKLRAPLLTQLAKLPGVYVDTARVDGTDAVPKLARSVAAGRVLFGSHSPFLIPEAALIRTHESGLLDDAGLRAVLAGNAREFLELNS